MGRNPNDECSQCEKPIYRRPSDKKKYLKGYCPECKGKVYKEAAISRNQYQYSFYIERWKAGKEDGMRGKTGVSKHIERYLRLKFGNKCTRCDWKEVNEFTGKVPVQVEHMDGDYSNNKEDNLDLICPSCHSLTATYCGANRGRGRPRK